jgi:Galactose oxidase, central domain
LKRLLAGAALALFGCSAKPDVALDIRLPDDRRLLAAVSALNLSAERDDHVLAQRRFNAGGPRYLSLSGVTEGPRTVLTLEGVTAAGDVQARGQSCPFDFAGRGETASIYFAPTNFFGPTVGTPLEQRDDPLVLALDDGRVLFAGGIDMLNEQALSNAELYSPSTSRFTMAAPSLNQARENSQLVPVSGVGALVVGGSDASRAPIGSSEVYLASNGNFVAFENDLLGPRMGHRVVVLPDGRVLVTGGIAIAAGTPLASTALVQVQNDGTATVEAGPPMNVPRREHAAVVAIGIAVVIGGYDVSGSPTASIEALVPDSDGDGTPTEWTQISALRQPRADATATLLQDGTILVVGGAVDSARTPAGDAEVYNPITRETTSYALGTARRRHSATLLPDGRVLVVGGIGSDKMPLSSVELFVPGVGFVSERSLGTARASHVAVPLCDGTVLVVGGGPGAELYTPSG